MRLLIILTILSTIIQSFRVAIYYLRKDISILRRIFETIILVIMIVLCYYDFEYFNKLIIYLSIIFDIYIVIMFIYERIFKNEYISVLSVKNGIDMSNEGIMFLNDTGDIILINNMFSNILKYFDIKNNYLDNLINNSFRKMDNSYLLKYNDMILELKINNNKEIIALDVTDIYKLHELEELQNKSIEENNKKIIETINNIEKIEKTKNLLKIKNEYHDILGHRLALFNKYLCQDKKELEDIKFLLDSIYDDLNNNLSSYLKIDNLVKMYHIIGVNINIKGNIPKNNDIADVFFEIIREAVTNAIIHAEAKNIYIIITEYLDRIEMTITNDGIKPKNEIYENEGIKGMRRKLNLINGSLSISLDNGFCLKIVI